MVAAKALLLSNSSQTSVAADSGVSQSRISQANAVLEHASELVDKVIGGHPDWSLNKAYEEAKKRKEAGWRSRRRRRSGNVSRTVSVSLPR